MCVNTLVNVVASQLMYQIADTDECVLDTVRQVPRKEGTVLFKDAINTFYLRLYGVILMV